MQRTAAPCVPQAAHGQNIMAPAPFIGLRSTKNTPQLLSGNALPNSFPRTLSAASKKAARKASRTGATAPRTVTTAGMNIVFVSAECAPWSKTGGLGDVVGGLPIALAKRGHKVMTISPRYDQYSDAWDTSVVINVNGEPVRFFHTNKKGVDRVWIDHPSFLAKVWGMTGSKLYGSKTGADYADNQRRFTLFSRAAIEALRCLPFSPGEDCIVVANDWHSCMVPVLLKKVYQPNGQFKNTKTALCVHNIAFQGRFWRESFKELSLDPSIAPIFEFNDGYQKVFDEKLPAGENGVKPTVGKFPKINWMKAGFLTSDRLLTVSPNYAREVASGPDKGVELDHIIRQVGGIEGIVNGMDTTDWNPKTDKFLDVKFDKSSVVVGKQAAKEALQAEAGLPIKPNVPVFGFIGRLEEQKGVDILLKAIPKFIESTNCQVVILGTGMKKLEAAVKALSKAYPGRCAGVVKFSAPMAHLICAGGDFMLVPSRFEPCGLIQLQAMQYGNVPLVASTGGLVDTVKEGVTGFHMGAFDPDELTDADASAVAQTVKRACEVYGTDKYRQMSYRCISQDLSWDKPAAKWEGVFMEMLGSTGGGAGASGYVAPAGTALKNSIKTPVALAGSAV